MKFILENPESSSIKQITEKLNITRRTFYYDVEQINDWLSSEGLGKLVIKSRMVTIDSDRRDELVNRIKRNESYFYSIEERRILELIFISLSTEVVTIEKMQKIFDVSKNTILTDIKEWKAALIGLDISIVSTIKVGYVLQGEEFTIRKMIGKQIKKLENFQPKIVLGKWMQESLVKISGEEYDYREIARCLIKQYEQDENIKLVSENEEFECSMILVSWIRSMEGYTVVLNAEERAALAVTCPYQSLKKSFQKLKEYNLEIPNSEIYYIATLLLGIKIAQFVSQDQENLYIYRFTASLLKNFERIACIAFENRERLANRLRGHIRPLYYRLKYGMQSTNPLLKDVMRMYPEIYEFTERSVRAMPDELAQTLTDDEIAYLAVYFISDEKKQVVTNTVENKSKILVLCAAGMATSTLVKEQLKELLGNIADIEVGIVSEAEKYRLDNYTLIVSTSYSDILNQHRNTIFTEVVLQDKDKRKIIQLLNQYGIVGRYDRTIQRIIASVEDNLTGQIEKNELYFDILRILYEDGKRESIGEQISFRGYMEDGCFVKIPKTGDMEELLIKGCQTAVHEKSWKRLYDRLYNMIRRHRLKYYEIQKNVVLIHCPMQGDMNRSVGFSVVVSETVIPITEYISGKIFIFFVTIDQRTHFALLKEIYDYCDSGEGRELLETVMKD